MLLTFILWSIASFIFISFGDATIAIFNSITKKEESYNLIETFIIGIFAVLIPLGITSIWLPTNYWMLAIYALTSVLYWLIRQERFIKGWNNLKLKISSFSKIELITISLILVSMLLFIAWTSYFYDSVNYHYQLTHWYEKIGTVPGLVNIESRLGFNSNYLLLSALFSFRTVLDEPIYILQSLFAIYLIIWIIQQIIRSNYERKTIILLLLFFIFIGAYFIFFFTSSTDILPSLIIFYITASLLLFPDKFHKQYLLLFITPACLITLKLSIVPIILISLYISYLLLKQKKYKIFITLSVICLLIVVPWLIRNVILTGYLVYPFPAIDWFSVDWKAPLGVVELEKDYIKDYAWHQAWIDYTMKPYRKAFLTEGWRIITNDGFIFALLNLFINVLAFITPFIICYLIYKRRVTNAVHILLFIMLTTILLVWSQAPNNRFIAGILFGLVYMLFVFLFDKQKKYYKLLGKFSLILVSIIMLCFSIGRTTFYYNNLRTNNSSRNFYTFLLKPYGVKEQNSIAIGRFDQYKLGSHTIYLSNEHGSASYDYLPSTQLTQKAEDIVLTTKFYPLQGVEARGNQLKDGFKPIDGYDSKIWEREDDWWDKFWK